MKQSLAIATLVFAALAFGTCTGSGSCEGLQCGSEGSSIQDDVTMLQVSIENHQQKSVAASSSESVTMLAAKMQEKHAESVMMKKSGSKGFEFRYQGGGQCTDEDGELVKATDTGSLGWSSCTGETTGYAQGGCTSVDECAAECTTNPDCGALGYWWGNCWLYAKMTKPYTTVNTDYPYFECYAKVETCSTAGTKYCITGEYQSSSGRSFSLHVYGDKMYCWETTPSSSSAAVSNPITNKRGNFYEPSTLKMFGYSGTYAEGIISWSNGYVWTYKGPYTEVPVCTAGTKECFTGKYMSSSGREFKLAPWQEYIYCSETTPASSPAAVSNPEIDRRGYFYEPSTIKLFCGYLDLDMGQCLTGELADGVISWSNGYTWTYLGPLY